MDIYAGVDIGGTSIKYGLIDENGRVIFRASAPTPAAGGGEAVALAAEAATESLLEREASVRGVGISTAGTVDEETGSVTYANDNLPGYGGIRWGDRITRRFGLPWSAENDVNAAALAESWVGAAKGLSDFFCVTIGTGVGGAIFIGGRLWRGANKRAAQIGCMTTAGGTQRYEKKASARALAGLARGHDMCGGAKEIFDGARAGDERALGLLRVWFDEAAKGIANVIFTLDPGVIVIGGGVSGAGDILTDGLTASLRAAVPQEFLSGTELRRAACGNDAGIIGAVRPFIKSAK
jgi:glucokinase